MRLSDAALLPIDMHRALDQPEWSRRWNRNLDRNGLALLDDWRRAGAPIVHVRHDALDTDSTLRFDQPGHAFWLGLEPRSDEAVVTKSVNAPFIGTDLELQLRRMQPRTVVAFGLSTDPCVSTTVRVGANLGYRTVPWLKPATARSTRRDRGTLAAEEVQRVHVASLAFEFATILITVEAVAAVSAGEHPTP